MKQIISALFTVCISAWCAFAAPLPRSTPEKQGISSSAILEFVEAAGRQIDALHSVMIVRHGHVVAEGWWSPYGPGTPHMMFSLSKSFTATAVGLAIAEGRISLDDPVLKFFATDAPTEPSANLKAMRIRDLLSMSTGHHTEDLQKFSFQTNEVLTRAFLALPVAHKPGTHFLYNTPATYMCSAIVQQVSGQTVLDYLRSRLFEPLGIENPTWSASPQGISHGGYGLNVKTEDIARFGQLYLQKGRWQGRQLVPPAWVEAATARQTSNGSSPTSDWEQGYGYQFWRSRHGSYRGDGAYGQFCFVLPEQDAVIAITSGTRDMQGVMNLVWTNLLPAMQPRPIRADLKARIQLEEKLARLVLPTPQGRSSSPLAAKISGPRYLFPGNDQKIESIVFEFNEDGAVLQMRNNGVDHRIPVGHASWQRSRSLLAAGLDQRVVEPKEQPVAGGGAWTADDTYTVKLAFYETPLVLTLRCRFDGEQVFIDPEYNVVSGAGSAKRAQLVSMRQVPR